MSEPQKEQRRIFLETVRAYHLKWYDWGGQGPGGVDCSGLVVEGLRACGLLANRQDMSADTMWRTYRAKYAVPAPREGCVIFWFNKSGRAIHTAVGVGPQHCIGAHGGDSDITDSTIAESEGAFVKYRPIYYRTEPFKCIDLFS